jgi:hypothetical protein
MTPAQREHAELHRKRRSGGRSRSKVLDDKVLVEVSNDYQLTTRTQTARQMFEGMACRADAVFAGTVTSSEVLPVSDGTALFSNYHVAVTQVFRTATSSRVFSGDELVVTRPGGVTMVEGEKVGTRVGGFPPLSVGGHYLFFVKYLPKYKTYDATSPLAVLSAYNATIRSFVALNPTDADVTSAGVAYGTVASWLQGVWCK